MSEKALAVSVDAFGVAGEALRVGGGFWGMSQTLGRICELGHTWGQLGRTQGQLGRTRGQLGRACAQTQCAVLNGAVQSDLPVHLSCQCNGIGLGRRNSKSIDR